MANITKIYGSTGDATVAFENAGWKVFPDGSEKFTATKGATSIYYVEGDISGEFDPKELPKDMIDAMPDSNPKGAKIIRTLKSMVSNGSMGKIGGKLVDIYSASAVIQVFNAASPESRKKMLAMDISDMVSVAFKVIRR